jgi:hypothetical protein
MFSTLVKGGLGGAEIEFTFVIKRRRTEFQF